ncbi:MAG: VOC family protein [Acidobacteria bacterium]|nr:VOC family protein [Acidobacteriota bacterium]
MQSAVEFATNTRIHIALETSTLDEAIAFYRTMFAQEPVKVKPGYAKFEVADPPVNLSLNAAAQAHATSGASHFGVQVKSTDAVHEAKQRFETAGYGIETEEHVTCCWAVQDKVWVRDPDGNAWEIFVVLDADAAVHGKADSDVCCAPAAELVTLG